MPGQRRRLRIELQQRQLVVRYPQRNGLGFDLAQATHLAAGAVDQRQATDGEDHQGHHHFQQRHALLASHFPRHRNECPSFQIRSNRAPAIATGTALATALR